MPAQKYQPGIPTDILAAIARKGVPPNYIRVYGFMYNHSRYVSDPGYRIVCFTEKYIARHLSTSTRTVRRATHYLRTHYYILPIWRGRPQPKKEKYYQSAYELPYNMAHVISWRIHKGRRPKD